MGGFYCECADDAEPSDQPDGSAGAQGDTDAEGASGFVSDDEAYGLCALALGLACGFPPAGESCEEIEDGGVRLACVADGQGNWDCECPVPECSEVESADVEGAAESDLGEGTTTENGARPAEPPPELVGRPLTCWDAIWHYCGCP
jgi:hypothetical protein